MKKEDIFNLNVTDFPDDLKKELNLTVPRLMVSRQIISLFDIMTPLTVTQILVGMYKKYDVILTRRYVIQFLHRYSKGEHVYKERRVGEIETLWHRGGN